MPKSVLPKKKLPTVRPVALKGGKMQGTPKGSDLEGWWPTEYRRMMKQYGKGHCITCGFLCKMAQDVSHVEQYWDIERATLLNRGQGQLFSNQAGKLEAVPECFVNAVDIYYEMIANAEKSIPAAQAGSLDFGIPQNRQSEIALSIVTKKRQCKEWTPWLMHLTPIQHLERKTMLDLDRQNRRLQRRILWVAIASGVVALVSAYASYRALL